jgi:hypothetical protein
MKKWKVTYKNGQVQFGTMNSKFGNGKYLLNLFNCVDGVWIWNHKLGGPACFNVDTHDQSVVKFERIDIFPEGNC